MNSKVLLRIAFGIILFHLLGHTIGHFTWKETEDPALAEIIQKMDTHVFEFMGTKQTIGGNHEGYSVMLGLTLVMLAIITWMFSGRINSIPQLAPVIVVIGVFFILFGIIEAIYFFPLPGITSVLAGAFYTAAAAIRQKS
jgi:hypothetical protein